MLEGVVVNLQHVESTLNDAKELMEMALAENDDDSLLSIGEDIGRMETLVAEMEFRRMFSGEMDANNAVIEIQAGSGGTEAQDWASMLLRMYLRYCERKGFKVEILEQSDGEVAGIKGASLKVTGEYAFGHLRTETGVHRLVRKSPFDSGNRRHTSFSSVFVYPEVDESIEIENQPRRSARGYLPCLRRGWSAHQQDRLGSAYYPRPHRHCGAVPERPFSTSQPRRSNGNVKIAHV